MNFIVRILTILTPILKRFGLCAKIGLVIGVIAGLSLSVLNIESSGVLLNTQQAFYISFILTGFTWLFVLFLLGVLQRMTLKSVVLPTLFNCLLTCLGTTFITRYLDIYPFAWLIGMAVGLLVGTILCRINNYFKNLKR